MCFKKLFLKANRSRIPVGWYATGTEIKEHYKLIHQSRYMTRSQSAPFLLVNANVFIGDKTSMKAYVCREVGIPNGAQGHIFVPIEVQLDCYGAERCAVEMMAYTLDPRSKLRPEVRLVLSIFYIYDLWSVLWYKMLLIDVR